MKKLYQLGWSHEGFGWRKKNTMFFLISPTDYNPKWLLRRVHGQPGKQAEEREFDAVTKSEAFKTANKMIRRLSKE